MHEVFRFGDYRSYLAEFYRREKERSRAFSYRSFAKRAGLSSPNYLKLVIDGKRPVTEKNLGAFLKGLRLSGPPADYFRVLVSLHGATDVAARGELLDRLLRLRVRHSGDPVEVNRDRFEILRSWRHWAIREMSLLEEFREDPAWIARRLRRRITPAQAAESLELLQRLGFLARQDGRLRPSEAMISTSDEISSLIIRQLHRQFTEAGLVSLFNDPLDLREVSGLTLTLRREEVPVFKRMMKEFRRELNRQFSGEQPKPDAEVYHLESIFFPLTQKGGEGDDENA